MKKAFKKLKYWGAAASAGTAFLVAGLLSDTFFLLSAAVILILPFIIIQYYLLIKHCRNYYLENYKYSGSYKKLLLFFLYLEPAGLIRLFYFIKQVRPYLQDKRRYAYTEKIYKRKLKDLKVTIFKEKNDGGVEHAHIAITNSPVYAYLETEEEEIWNNYHYNVVRKRHPDFTYSIKKFNRLVKSIKEKGFSDTAPPIRVKDGIISDGMHRACIFYYIYGPEFEVNVIYNKTCNNFSSADENKKQLKLNT